MIGKGPVKLEITGEEGSGKTTLMIVIAKTLTEKGYLVRTQDSGVLCDTSKWDMPKTDQPIAVDIEAYPEFGRLDGFKVMHAYKALDKNKVGKAVLRLSHPVFGTAAQIGAELGLGDKLSPDRIEEHLLKMEPHLAVIFDFAKRDDHGTAVYAITPKGAVKWDRRARP